MPSSLVNFIIEVVLLYCGSIARKYECAMVIVICANDVVNDDINYHDDMREHYNSLARM